MLDYSCKTLLEDLAGCQAACSYTPTGRSGGGNSLRQREWLADTMAPKTSSGLVPKATQIFRILKASGVDVARRGQVSPTNNYRAAEQPHALPLIASASAAGPLIKQVRLR